MPDPAPPVPPTVAVNNRMYEEVAEDIVQKLNLSVASCDGLTAIGEIEGSYLPAPAYAYAYPDARYPNLIVAMLDGKPAIFQFCNFTGIYTSSEALINLYGLSTADSISEISITHYKKLARKPTITETAKITAQAEREQFIAALHDFPTGVSGSIAGADYYPQDCLDVTLANGLSCTFYYYPKVDEFYHASAFFPCSDSMRTWINEHIEGCSHPARLWRRGGLKRGKL